MEYITVSAKTVDDAITEALIQLGVTSDKLDYEVIEKGSAGFLGIGMKQAVIKARKKEEPKEEPVAEEVKEEPKKEIVKEHKESKKEHKKEFKKEKAEEIKEEKAEVKEPEQKKESELANAVAADQICEILFMPFVEITGIVVLGLFLAPHIESLVHHQQTH